MGQSGQGWGERYDPGKPMENQSETEGWSSGSVKEEDTVSRCAGEWLRTGRRPPDDTDALTDTVVVRRDAIGRPSWPRDATAQRRIDHDHDPHRLSALGEGLCTRPPTHCCTRFSHGCFSPADRPDPADPAAYSALFSVQSMGHCRDPLLSDAPPGHSHCRAALSQRRLDARRWRGSATRWRSMR